VIEALETRAIALRVFDHRDFGVERLRRQRTTTVSVCLPARNERTTIGPILQTLLKLMHRDVIDQIVVVDDSTDGTADLAAALGVEVHRQADLRPEFGSVLGKGDAMWRALTVLEGDIVCFLDADSEAFGEHFACGLIGPLLFDADLQFVKGFYRRPFRTADVIEADGGGRVTELTARPLLSLFYPELASVRQPLAGEIAVRRELLRTLPFTTGYGVDIGLLIDAWKAVGVSALAQVDLEVRQNAHKPLAELGAMSYVVLAAVASRLVAEGRLDSPGELPFVDSHGKRHLLPLVDRPPLNVVDPEGET
jgi:glucosyl-3-phosphoglycerate synthase